MTITEIKLICRFGFYKSVRTYKCYVFNYILKLTAVRSCIHIYTAAECTRYSAGKFKTGKISLKDFL